MSFLRTLLALSFVAHLSSAQAAAPGVHRAQSNATSPAVQALERLRTARALARYGEDKKDALALIVAARMTIDIEAQTIPLTRKGRRDADAPSSNASPSASPAVAWLARAKALASDRPDLIALADDVGSVKGRGKNPEGPRMHPLRIKGGYTDQFPIAFRGGEPAAVAISGDEDSRLDLYIYDENGKRVCADTGGAEEKFCRWTPERSGRYVVRVVNRGPEAEYVLRTNQ